MEMKDNIKQLIETLNIKRNYVNKLIKDLSKLEKLIKEPIKNVFTISKLIKEMELKYKDKEYTQQLLAILDEIKDTNKKNEEEFIYNFSKELKEAFQAQGINLSGNYPEYSIGIFNLKVNFNLGKAEFYFCKELIKGNITLDIKSILKAYEVIDKEIRQRRFDAKSFINLLYEAYRRVIILSGLEVGKRVNIIEVMKELAILMQGSSFVINPKKDNYHSYGRAYFSYDLYRLKMLGMLEYMGKRMSLGTATIDYAGKDKYSLYVYDDLTGGNYVMYISFIDINKEV